MRFLSRSAVFIGACMQKLVQKNKEMFFVICIWLRCS